MTSSDFPLPVFRIMGIVNCTPDSFSDGGLFTTPRQAIRHGLSLARQGADIIDIGAESTRPGAADIQQEDEWGRLEPVLSQLLKELPSHISVSIDTRKPGLMIRAADMGVRYINNVAGLAGSSVLKRLSTFPGLRYIAMHMHRQPANMQTAPLIGAAAVSEVSDFFRQAADKLAEAGFKPGHCYFDPGIGFGKDDQANLMLMGHTPAFSKDYNMVLGVSRKSWLGRCLELPEPQTRDAPSKIAEIALAFAGASIIRTHDVRSLNRLRRIVYKMPK